MNRQQPMVIVLKAIIKQTEEVTTKLTVIEMEETTYEEEMILDKSTDSIIKPDMKINLVKIGIMKISKLKITIMKISNLKVGNMNTGNMNTGHMSISNRNIDKMEINIVTTDTRLNKTQTI